MQQILAAFMVIVLILGKTQSSPAPSLSSSSLSLPSSSSSSSLDFSSLSKNRHARSTSRRLRQRICSRNTPCMWAYCPWSPKVLLENDDCKYIDSIRDGVLSSGDVYVASRQRICSRNTPCMWAYCPWSPKVLLENDDCKYIDSICVCQWGQTCSRTNDVRPDNDYLTVPFTCKWISPEYAALEGASTL